MTDATITELGRGGDGVVLRGKDAPVYVRGALPSERVRLGKITKERSILRAPLLERLSTSALRRTAACTVVDRCGGCPLAHVTREGQRDTKRSWLAAELEKKDIDTSALEIELIVPEPAQADAAYRVRARLAWSRASGASEAVIGYREGEAREVITPERCEVLHPRVERGRRELTAALAPLLQGRGELRLGLSSQPSTSESAEREQGVVLAITSEAAPSSQFFTAIESLVAQGVLVGATVQVGGAGVATRFGDARERSLDLEGRLLDAPIGVFRQAHVAASEALGSRVIAWGLPEGRDVIELHAGHGNFTLALASRARSLVAVELEREATDALRENLRAHALEADVRTLEATKALDAIVKDVRTKRREKPGLVVLDPPRTGANDEMARIEALSPERVVYVSCDAGTFARDAAVLGRTLPLRRLALVDLFPDTLHLELVALFDKTQNPR